MSADSQNYYVDERKLTFLKAFVNFSTFDGGTTGTLSTMITLSNPGGCGGAAVDGKQDQWREHSAVEVRDQSCPAPETAVSLTPSPTNGQLPLFAPREGSALRKVMRLSPFRLWSQHCRKETIE